MIDEQAVIDYRVKHKSTIYELAKVFNCEAAYIWVILRKNNIPGLKHRKSKNGYVQRKRHTLRETPEKVMDLRNKGLTLKQVAERLNCSAWLVHDIENCEKERIIAEKLKGNF